MRRYIFLIIYYGFATYLPNSYTPLIGGICNKIRILCVKNIFKSCGKIRTINRKVFFGGGKFVEMGDESGIGTRVELPNNTIIGKNVTISRDVFILSRNFIHSNINVPMNDQGKYPFEQTVIEDDCWIGLKAIITPGRIIKKGS